MTRTSPRGRRPVRRSSSTSRSSTTASAGTRRWGTSPRQSTNGITVNPLSTFRGEFHFTTGAVVEVGCWAHARRKFLEAQKTDPEGALYALGVIRQLYAVERDVTERASKQVLSRAEFEALRVRLRQERSVPLLKSFGEWLNKQAAAVLPKSPLGEAVGYAR